MQWIITANRAFGSNQELTFQRDENNAFLIGVCRLAYDVPKVVIGFKTLDELNEWLRHVGLIADETGFAGYRTHKY
jgi:hypothetical protein